MAKNKFHDGPGPSQRQLRVAELIRRTLSDVLARGDVHDPDLNRMSITVGEVRTSPDLKIATAYVLPLGGQGQDEVIRSEEHTSELQSLTNIVCRLLLEKKNNSSIAKILNSSKNSVIQYSIWVVIVFDLCQGVSMETVYRFKSFT